MTIKHPKNVFWLMVLVLIVCTIAWFLIKPTPPPPPDYHTCQKCNGTGQTAVLWVFKSKCKACGGAGGWVEGNAIRTVDEYKAAYVSKIECELAKANAAWRSHVKRAHLTVKPTKAYVLSCEVKTLDGSRSAGKNDSNISEVVTIIRCSWDGKYHKNGHTDLKITVDKKSPKQPDVDMIDTDAWINLKSKAFWLGILTGLPVFGLP